MIIEIPYLYEVTGTRPRGRSIYSSSGLGVTQVEIPEIPKHELEIAVEFMDADGIWSETVYHHQGAFWIADDRRELDAFGHQHLNLVGILARKSGFIREARHHRTFTQSEAAEANLQSAHKLGELGITNKMILGYWTPYHMVDGQPKFTPMDPSADYRQIDGSTESTRKAAAIAYAEVNTAWCDGRLYHKVPEPVIFVGSTKADWGFGAHLRTPHIGWEKETYDTWLETAYRIPLSAYDDLPDNFPKIAESSGIRFYVNHYAPEFFVSEDVRPAVIKDLIKATHHISVYSDSTAFIKKWCDLKDLIGTSEKQIEQLDDDTIDHACEIVEELMILKPERQYPGVKMWLNREIGSLGLSSNNPTLDA